MEIVSCMSVDRLAGSRDVPSSSRLMLQEPGCPRRTARLVSVIDEAAFGEDFGIEWVFVPSFP